MDTNDEPLISIVIPAFNAEMYLLDAVRSAQSQVHQNIQILIIDDGSTDKSLELAVNCSKKDPRIQVISQANAGLSSARNTGLRHATGDYVSFLDSDDTIHPLKISRQIAELERTGAGIAFCDYYTTDEALVPQAISQTRPKLADISAQLPLQNVFPPHAALVRREVVDQVGGFDESLPSAEDWDYWIRCAEVTSMVHVPGALCAYRRHSGQMHNDRQRMRISQFRVIRARYCAGSWQRRVAFAGMHMGEAKFCYSQGRLMRMLVHLIKVAVLARSPRRALQVIRIAGYG